MIPLTGGPQRSQIRKDGEQMLGPGAGGGERSEYVMRTERQFGNVRKLWRWAVGTVV